MSEQTAEYGYRLTDEERALIASKSPGNDETAGWEYALLFRTVESVVAARLAAIEAVCAEWDAEPSLPPAAYNAIDDVRAALSGS